MFDSTTRASGSRLDTLPLPVLDDISLNQAIQFEAPNRDAQEEEEEKKKKKNQSQAGAAN
jgi:hypothetical protein